MMLTAATKLPRVNVKDRHTRRFSTDPVEPRRGELS